MRNKVHLEKNRTTAICQVAALWQMFIADLRQPRTMIFWGAVGAALCSLRAWAKRHGADPFLLVASCCYWETQVSFQPDVQTSVDYRRRHSRKWAVLNGHDSSMTSVEHESPLGRWGIVLRRVHPALSGIITQLWHGAGRVAYKRDRILPRAQSYLLINLGPPQYMVLRGEPEIRVAFDDIWFSGISDIPIDTEAPHGNVLLGVAFTACGAASLLGLPQYEIANRTGSFADLFGRAAFDLRDRLLEFSDAASRLQLAEEWLLSNCVSGRHIHPLVAWATRRLAESGGKLRTAELARDAGCSRKHIAGLFRDRVGLAPKTLARIHRFQNALVCISADHQVDWSELATHCGYYDQAHLIHDFRQFAGLAPTEFVRCARPDAGSVVLR